GDLVVLLFTFLIQWNRNPLNHRQRLRQITEPQRRIEGVFENGVGCPTDLNEGDVLSGFPIRIELHLQQLNQHTFTTQPTNNLPIHCTEISHLSSSVIVVCLTDWSIPKSPRIHQKTESTQWIDANSNRSGLVLP